MRAARGKHIISAAKSVKATQLAGQNIAAYLDAISIAGRAGLFAAALRHAGKISLERGRCWLFMRGFSQRELRQTLLSIFLAEPAEESQNFVCYNWYSFVLRIGESYAQNLDSYQGGQNKSAYSLFAQVS